MKLEGNVYIRRHIAEMSEEKFFLMRSFVSCGNRQLCRSLRMALTIHIRWLRSTYWYALRRPNIQPSWRLHTRKVYYVEPASQKMSGL